MINSSNIEDTKKQIKSSNPPIMVKAQNDEYNRKVLEYGKIDSLVFPDNQIRKTTIRNLDSGLNQVLAKIARKNKVAIALDLKEIRQTSKKQKALIMQQFIEIAKICKKNSLKLNIINSTNSSKYLLKSLKYS